jgi:hypothetical protein
MKGSLAISRQATGLRQMRALTQVKRIAGLKIDVDQRMDGRIGQRMQAFRSLARVERSRASLFEWHAGGCVK